MLSQNSQVRNSRTLIVTVFLVKVETQDFQKLMLWHKLLEMVMQEHHVTGYSMIGILMESLLGVYISILPRLVESKQGYIKLML